MVCHEQLIDSYVSGAAPRAPVPRNETAIPDNYHFPPIFVRTSGDGQEELYDIENDPLEQNDLSQDEQSQPGQMITDMSSTTYWLTLLD